MWRQLIFVLIWQILLIYIKFAKNLPTLKLDNDMVFTVVKYYVEQDLICEYSLFLFDIYGMKTMLFPNKNKKL